MRLDEIKIIDMKSSKWDEKLSDPKTGKYFFTDKQYVSYRGKGRRPDYYWTWERFDPRNNYMDLNSAKFKGFEPVSLGDPDFLPEGVPPVHGSGYFVFVDVVLVKCPLEVELRRRKEARDMSDNAKKATIGRFKREAAGIGAGLSDAEADDLLGM